MSTILVTFDLLYNHKRYKEIVELAEKYQARLVTSTLIVRIAVLAALEMVGLGYGTVVTNLLHFISKQ